MPTNDMTRRQAMTGLVAAGVLLALGRPVLAAATDRASALVTTLAQELTQLVRSGRSEAQVVSAFQGIVTVCRFASSLANVAAMRSLSSRWAGTSLAN